MNVHIQKLHKIMVVVAASFLLHACSNDNNAPMVAPPPPPPPPAMATFDVTVTNLTNAQPLSPVAVIAHQAGYAIFAVGSPATVGLEELAEGGDNAALLADAGADMLVFASGSGAAPIGPAGSETVTIDVLENDLPGLLISVATMLVNTNDAFSGPGGILVGDMAAGDIRVSNGIAYDAGTEAHSEAASDIPGPAGGGEGFNAVRDDLADQVSAHSGIVSQDDGLATSDLTEQHRFDNPVLSVRIERVN